MFSQDFSHIAAWWSLLFFIGAVFFPFTKQFFPVFIDKGYIFSKIAGILFVSYCVWLFGILKIFPFSQFSIILVLGLSIVGNLIFLRIKKGSSSVEIGPKKKLLVVILGEEIIFFLALCFWSFVKAHQPDLNSLEKFMDFGFINSILRSNYFPPLDMWLAKSPSYQGYFINYYYFGHLTTAVLTKLSGIKPDIAYNLMLSGIFAFTFTGSFSLAVNLIYNNRTHKPIKRLTAVFSGFLSAFLVSLAGNLHTIYAFTKGYTPADKPVPFWELLGRGMNLSAYWYPNATRFIPYTIHEFPGYSFVVSDLHGHVLDIPFVLLTIALLLSFVLQVKHNSKKQNSKVFLALTFLGLSLAAMYMTNAWDGLIYFALSALIFLYINLRDSKNLSGCIIWSIKHTAPLLLLFILFSLPFQLSFKPFVSGIGISKDHSPLWMLFILWGYFYYNAFGFFAFIVFPNIKSLGKNFIKLLNPVDVFIILLIIISSGLLIFPEFFYVKDIYPQHYRANTMFKLGYQAFIMLSLCSGYIITRLFSFRQTIKFQFSPKFMLFALYFIILIFLTFLVLFYPYFSINTYFDRLKNYKGLGGLSYMMQNNLSDYQAIKWIESSISGQPVVLEAVGDSYTEYSRISANTGLPTILGWPVHEWLWRGGYDEPGKRVEEVKKAYQTKNLKETKNFLKKYNVSYVIFGKKEKEKYAEAKEEKWKQLGTVVFSSGETRIYKIMPAN
jgi:uncharacterized membrane protein